jgi:hypothetical protein
MNRRWTWCLICLLAVGNSAWSKDKMAGGDTEKAVAALGTAVASLPTDK